MKHPALLLPLVVGGLAMAPGCSSDSGEEPDTPEVTATPSPGACDIAVVGQQPISRFPTGHTFYLPRYKEPESCGDDPTWRLTSQPAAALSDLEEGDDGIARFTPHQVGTYEFTTTDGQGPITLEVVDAEAQPFVNYNYYGTHTQAQVDGELWVANVMRPSISRIDPGTLESLGEIQTGPWPVALAHAPGMDVVLVAQRAGDTLGFVDLDTMLLLDAIWVGDEPADVVVSEDGARAYVSLPTQGEVVVIDVDDREILARIETVNDAIALALSPDGERLYVASHRSGSTQRYPYSDDPVEEERDIEVINTRSFEVETTFLDVATLINRLAISDDGERLYLACRQNNTAADLASTEDPTFTHQVAMLNASDGSIIAAADIARQDTAEGAATAAHGLALTDDCVWVTAESSDVTLCLDPDTLEERFRADTPGRPRDVLPLGTGAVVHGAQAFTIARIADDGSLRGDTTTATDPRSRALRNGQAFFTGQGQEFAEEYSCNSCHVDGLTDTLIWNAGPFVSRMVPRPLFWLEGTWRLGWTGYLSSVENFAFTGATTIGVRPTTQESEDLAVYLASIMPPPAPNGLTTRDGSLSEQALRGQAVFEGRGACVGCHPGPLFTNQETLAQGITQDATEPEADIPSLVGVYRHGVWMKSGNARTLEDSSRQAAEWLGINLSDDEIADLTRYVAELTTRDFFVLDSKPRPDREMVSVNAPIEVTFSHPVYGASENLEKVELVRATGGTVGLQRSLSADGRHLTLTPATELAFESTYLIRVGEGLESLDERVIVDETVVEFTTGAQPSMAFEGEYLWTTYLPSPDFESGGLDPSNTIEGTAYFQATTNTSGAEVVVDYTGGLTQTHQVTVSGDTLYVPTLPIPFGFGFADGSPLVATLEDNDGDGIADAAAGTLNISGPGFNQGEVEWVLRRPTAAGTCVEGTSGSPLVNISANDEGEMVIDFGDSELVGLYVTDPDAILPGGPFGTVNGEAYWVIEAANYPPNGFLGPVTYQTLPDGAEDASTRHGGIAGGTELAIGQCYKVSVSTVDFTVGSRTVLWTGE